MGKKRFIKRLLDILCASFLLVFFAPVFLLLMISLFLFNKGGVFFYQERPGLKGKLFKIIKFKTMSDERGPDGVLLSDVHRLTKIGGWIRNRSLDEIPQLINVLRGDMSMVGPRPLLVEYLDRYNEYQLRRHEVLPGVSGWAQINGRNGISWEEKFKLDIWYVEHHSVLLDAKILLHTILRVYQGKGVSQEGQVSMVPFKRE